MSLKTKVEKAFKALLKTALPDVQVLTSQEVPTEPGEPGYKAFPVRVLIDAQSGQPVSPRARTLRYSVMITVETNADATDEHLDPIGSHIAATDSVHEVLDDDPSPLDYRLSQLSATVGDLGVNGYIILGDMGSESQAENRAFRDSWGYLINAMEARLY